MPTGLHLFTMLQDGKYPLADEEDGFAARLRQVVNSYGSTSALARTIQRSEGAIRKWLRGQSEPAVSDLRSICEATQTNVEWLVMGRGDPKGGGVRSPPAPAGGDDPLPPLNYKLMDEVVLSVDLEPKIGGTPVTAEKCSSILTTVYNMSRMSRRVDRESVDRILGLSLG
jgi:hypothetical protein